jgi:hypothetical protein
MKQTKGAELQPDSWIYTIERDRGPPDKFLTEAQKSRQSACSWLQDTKDCIDMTVLMTRGGELAGSLLA